MMVGFIDDHRGEHGVEPICDVLPIAPSTYYDHLAKRADPARRSDRARRDEDLRPEIKRVFEDNWSVYGVRKVWHQLRREGFDVARCTVARLMKDMDIRGIIRGKPHRTTIPDKKQPCPLDKVNRQFRVPAPNMLWVSDFTYVATWKGFVYVAFVIDAYARRIVGWRVSTSAHAGFVLDALEQAVHDCRPGKGMGLVHHSDRGSQYLSIKYTERLAEAGIERSVGSVGDSYDNALAETINGLFKAEVRSWRPGARRRVSRCSPRRSMPDPIRPIPFIPRCFPISSQRPDMTRFTIVRRDNSWMAMARYSPSRRHRGSGRWARCHIPAGSMAVS